MATFTLCERYYIDSDECCWAIRDRTKGKKRKNGSVEHRVAGWFPKLTQAVDWWADKSLRDHDGDLTDAILETRAKVEALTTPLKRALAAPSPAQGAKSPSEGD